MNDVSISPSMMIEPPPQSKLLRILKFYCLSGWGVFIPYTFAYLIFAIFDLPVSSRGMNKYSGLFCLLHIYWFLHFLHVFTGFYILYQYRNTWSPITALRKIGPWVCIVLIIAIPGAYLEYPSDPWEHLARINEWGFNSIVTDHHAWRKSSYFLAYSIVGHETGSNQFVWLGLYYVIISLLLCLQFYRLARAVKLPRSAAVVFVILQLLLFGNNIFSFFRYYGVASTIIAQIGAIAIIRIAIEYSNSLTISDSKKNNIWLGIRTLGALVALGAVVLFNHIQAIGIAGLGVIATSLHALVRWRVKTIWWVLILAFLSSFLMIKFGTREPSLDDFFVTNGWLTTWYSFNLFDPNSVPGERTLQILGIVGIANLVGGLLLLRRNHVVSWLTLFPIVVFCLPVIVIPFVNFLLTHQEGNIITNVRTFNRMFLGIPTGLALITLGHNFLTTRLKSPLIGFSRLSGHFPCGIIILLLTLVTTIPPGAPFFNRTWNSFMIVPHDLQLEPHLTQVTKSSQINSSAMLQLPQASAFGAYAIGNRNIINFEQNRLLESYHIPVDQSRKIIESIIQSSPDSTDNILILPRGTHIYSTYSQAGYLSLHWKPHHVVLDTMGAIEIQQSAENSGWKINPNSDF